MLTIAGWHLVSLTPQHVASAAGADLLARLERAGFAVAAEELTATGYYVLAQNPR
jgi:hypothetical protein